MFIFDTLAHRVKRGCETMAYPAGAAPALPDRHGGALKVTAEKCPEACRACLGSCPTEALTKDDPDTGVRLDLGRCLFCSECVTACPTQALSHTHNHRLAVRHREDLVLGGGTALSEARLAIALESKLLKLFGRSLRLRQVSAGGCGACEADTNVLGTIGWDLGRFGIQFVASPRHADGLLITGPVTEGMELALKKTWDAVAAPKIAIAVGACAISGGPFLGHKEVRNGADSLIPIDLYVPGCPPHPLTILDGLLRLLDRLDARFEPDSRQGRE